MNDSPILSLQHVSKRFGGLQALDDVSFDLQPGEIHALVGENGAGKSTLMRILAGVYTEYDGEFILEGRPIRLQSPKDALNRGIGMIHQELSVITELSVAENLYLGRQPLTRWGTVDWKKMFSASEVELARLGFPDIDVRRSLGSYTLGMQQVVEVLRTIISGARILIMDEPTSALSPGEVERLIKLIDVIRQDQRSVIYISHFLEEVMRVADRVTVLRNGGKVATLDKSSTNVNQLIELILGHELTTSAHNAPMTQKNGQIRLNVSHLTSDVFNDISFDIHQGEIVGIYGAVGAGHFDLARAIFGMYRTNSGTITVDGHLFPHNYSARYAIKHGLAYATESRRKSLFMEEAIYRNITLPHLGKISGMIPRPARELQTALPFIKKVNVQPPDPMNLVGKLSGGNQQKVAIARWLTFPPKVFVMSEPTRGMDVGAKSEVLSILREFGDQGYGVLVVSTEPETILSVSNQVIVMSHGQIVAHMENKNLNKDVLMRNL